MPFHTALQQKNVPLRCTSSTLAKSAIFILANDLSRRIPALAHNRSTLPHSLVARSTIACTCSKLETSAPSAIATPPASGTPPPPPPAGVSDPPVPSRPPPKSLTTTLAPRLASPSACARPRPFPAPVTMATRPSNLIVIHQFLLSSFSPCGRRWLASQDASRMRGLSPQREKPLTRLISLRSFSSPTRGEGTPGNDGARSSKIDQADPVGHQSGIFLAPDFD